MKEAKEGIEFIKADEEILGAAIEDFKKHCPQNKVNGFALAIAEAPFVFKPLSVHFKELPSYEEVERLATLIFNQTVEGTCEEYDPDSIYYTDSRQLAIRELMCRLIIVDVFGGSFLPAEKLRSQFEMDESLKERVKVGRWRDHTVVQTLKDAPEITASLPGVGKVNIRRCPFCGRYDLKIPSKERVVDEYDRINNYYGDLISCSCGASLTVHSILLRKGNWQYKDIIRLAMDKWNTRA